MVNSTTLDRIAKHVKQNEGGNVDYPYLDVKGKVTAGPGFLVDDEASFVATPFKIGNRAATEAEKRSVFRQLEKEDKPAQRAGANNAANTYKGKTPLRLDGDFVNKRLHQEIEQRIGKIRKDIGDSAWDKLTDGQKTVLVDIHYANGSLEKFPNLKEAAKAGDAEAIAKESLFFADSDRGIRDNERLLRNYAAAIGKDVDDPKVRSAFNALRDDADRTWLRKGKENAAKLPDADERKKRAVYLETHPFNKWRGAEPDGEVEDAETKGKDLQGASSENHLTEDPEVSQLKSFLSAEGDPEDEAMLKDDLTEDEVKTVMMSKAYNDEKDPRFEAVNKRVAWWYEDRYGNEEARKDAAGRLIQLAEPKHPAPTRPLSSSVAKTGVPLTNEIAKVIEALIKPKRTMPTNAGNQSDLTLSGGNAVVSKLGAPRPSIRTPRARAHTLEEARLTSPRIATLQETLNSDDLRHGRSIIDEPLKIDGIAGPKTRRALRHTLARFGADGILSKWTQGHAENDDHNSPK